MRKIGILGSLLVIVTALTLFTLHRKGEGQGTVVMDEIRRLAPDVGSKVQGEYFLLHFWAKWCEPCTDEIPDLVQFARLVHEKKSPDGSPLSLSRSLQVVAVSLDPTLEESVQILPDEGKNLPPNFLLVLDAEQKFANKVGSYQYPETYLVGPDGQILEKWVGLQKWLQPQVFAFFSQKLH